MIRVFMLSGYLFPPNNLVYDSKLQASLHNLLKVKDEYLGDKYSHMLYYLSKCTTRPSAVISTKNTKTNRRESSVGLLLNFQVLSKI